MYNLLQINVTANTGSHGKLCEEIGDSILKNNGTSWIAYGRGVSHSQSRTIQVQSLTSFFFHVGKSRLFDLHGYGSLTATRNLIRKIQSINPDIIHLHNIHGYYLNIDIFFKFLKITNRPVVWTLHDCWSFTGHCAHFIDVNCERWKTHCYHCPLKKGYPASWFLDNSYRNFENKRNLFTGLHNLTVVSPSEWLKGILKESFLSKYEIRVINNGVNLDRFKPTLTNDSRSKYHLKRKYILGVANVWTKKKGLYDFIALRALIDRRIDVVLVGLSKNQIRALPDGMIGITRTENAEELAGLYSEANVFVNPTYVDNFPSVNIEALACGTPVITYRTGGSQEALDDNTGIIVERGNIIAIYNAISKIMTSENKFTHEQCRSRAMKYYSSKDRSRDYLNLYKEILSRE